MDRVPWSQPSSERLMPPADKGGRLIAATGLRYVTHSSACTHKCTPLASRRQLFAVTGICTTPTIIILMKAL